MRLNQERQEKLEPVRIEGTKRKLEALGYEVTLDERNKKLTFIHKNCRVTLYPYSGWFTGKTVTDGRGFKNLLRQIKT
jgi:hypothetical protein